MDSTLNIQSFKPVPMAELMHELEPDLYPMPAYLSHSAKRKPGSSKLPNTIEKTRIFTCAELQSQLSMLDRSKGLNKAKAATSVKKQRWDSSAKVAYKRKSVAANDQAKSIISARKMLTFQPKPKAQNSRTTMNFGKTNTEATKFPKPNAPPKKSNLISRNTMNMSGICKISETPVSADSKILKNRFIQQHNEKSTSILRKTIITPKHCSKVRFLTDKSLSSTSFSSNGDASFLLKEQEINNIIEKPIDKTTLKNEAEVSNLVSTPFKEYRNLKEFFNDDSEKENSPFGDGTIMCFDKYDHNENTDDADMKLLCDMLDKASLMPKKSNLNLEELMTFKRNFEKEIAEINNKILTLIEVKKGVYLKALQHIKKLKEDGQRNDDTSQSEPSELDNVTQESSTFRRPSVMPPTFKIHRKNSCLVKQAARKSLNMSTTRETPEKKDKALDMYMEIKETMNFLKTPQHRKDLQDKAVDTPTVTSHNLKKQLNKLFNES